MPYNVPDTVVTILSDLKHPVPNKCLGSLNADSVAKLPLISQIELVNRKLRLALGVFNEDTSDIRSKIYDNIDYDEWVLIFKRDIAPEILRLGA